ncbi:MAG: hypothetical protein V7637_4702 [Mycobacteriales bacterium]|jgi:ribosome-associated translation inhibitor RaiA
MGQLDTRTAPGIALHIVAGPGVPDAARESAAEMIGRLVAAVARPVPYAEVVLTLDEDPAHQRGALVEVSLDVVGAPVRACVAAADHCQAIDRVGAVLLRRVHLQHEWITTRLYASARRQ